jgi:hypothetical protein
MTMTTAMELGAMGGDNHLERTLINTLTRMSYLRGFGHAAPGVKINGDFNIPAGLKTRKVFS